MFSRSQSWWACLISCTLALLLASTLALVSTFVGPTSKALASDSPDNTTLLLVHGFDDTCKTAFYSATSGDTTQATPAMSLINNQLVWTWNGSGNPGNLYIAAQF